LVQSLDATVIPHGPQNIWLTSVAAPLGGTKSVDDSKLPAVAEFDYVRYFPAASSPETNKHWIQICGSMIGAASATRVAVNVTETGTKMI
jgi:hypothetical protein